ncbi:MAG TPA: GNAT family N-acetyltransferase [Verrucomicrobiae bacterium]|nr:GNAT family N-acetyltransferase [Verrucomicrobiae bacterium]
MNPINYKLDVIPSPEAVMELYADAGLRRPEDRDRIMRMYSHSNLVVTAWDKDRLVGVARALTDFCFCCYLSDLAVRKQYQHHGIGRELIRLTKEKIGDESMLLLLSAPAAMEYYPKVGMSKVENGFIIQRMK